jgi:hypothetical protein
MNILLTDEESLRAWEIACSDCAERHVCSLSACSKPNIIAKEQLKKVAEHIKTLPTDGHDKWYWYHQDLAESLLKECDE